MRQCVLERIESDKIVTLVTWLDTSKIKIGSTLSLKNDNDIWTVKSMSQTILSKKYIEDQSRDYLRTRKFSDI